jgi:hypothetical protein
MRIAVRASHRQIGKQRFPAVLFSDDVINTRRDFDVSEWNPAILATPAGASSYCGTQPGTHALFRWREG